MTADDMDHVTKLILDAVATARHDGWTIVRGSFGIDAQKSCCPIKALFLHDPESGSGVDSAAEKFGWDQSDVWAFLDGLDGKRQRADYRHDRLPYYDLGREVGALVFLTTP